MPNGRPGDNPLTDILKHGHSEFGDPVDSIVKKIADKNRSSKIMNEVEQILRKYSPIGTGSPESKKEAEKLLLEIAARLGQNGA